MATGRQSWMFAYPITCPEMCGLLREGCGELGMNEYYATKENHMRYALIYFDHKVQITTLWRCIETLRVHGVRLVQVARFDNSNPTGFEQKWFFVVERHIAERDERLVMWVKADEAALPSSDVEPSSKRPKRAVGEDAALLLAEKISQLELALAAKDAQLDCDKSEISALEAKLGQSDCMVVKLTGTISALEEKLARAVDTVNDLRKGRIEPSQRETMLVVDLNAERRRVREVIYQLHNEVLRFADEREKSSSMEKKLQERIATLEGEVDMIRHEARGWADDREVSRRELDKALDDLQVARESVDVLKARSEANQRENDKLRANAFDIVKTEIECENQRRDALAASRIDAIQRDSDHACAEWKRRNEMLRDELAAALKKR